MFKTFAFRNNSDHCGWQEYISSLSMNDIDVFNDKIKQYSDKMFKMFAFRNNSDPCGWKG
jgi:hypothetical protein